MTCKLDFELWEPPAGLGRIGKKGGENYKEHKVLITTKLYLHCTCTSCTDPLIATEPQAETLHNKKNPQKYTFVWVQRTK